METKIQHEDDRLFYHPIKGGQVSPRRRLVIFSASVTVHGLFFLCCWLFLSPVKVIVDHRIENVILVSRDELFLPPGFPQAVSSPAEVQADVRFQPQIESGYPDVPGTGLQTGAESEIAPGPTAELSNTGARPFEFQLSVPRIETNKLSSEFSLEPLRSAPSVPRLKSTDLMKYLGPTGYGSGSASSSGGKGRGSGVVSIQGRTFNIKPWADRVLQEIQRNWFLSPENRDTFVGEVEIKVTLSRNGEILSSEVTKTSDSATLDEVALTALRVAPLPRLPSDFPDDQLEIRLIFDIQ